MLVFRIPGQYLDAESGLNSNVNRDYEPTTGRYLQSGPIGLDGGRNTHGYVDQNPFGFIDPLGLQAVCLARHNGVHPGFSGPVPMQPAGLRHRQVLFRQHLLHYPKNGMADTDEESAMRYRDESVVRLFDIVDGGDGEATVVGIADAEEYAPGFQSPEGVNRDAGALGVFPDGSLKWRPLPGAPFRLCRRPGVDEIGCSDQGVDTRVLPVTAIPAYHGFYVDGQRIELLDVVETSSGAIGRVVAIISENLY